MRLQQPEDDFSSSASTRMELVKPLLDPASAGSSPTSRRPTHRNQKILENLLTPEESDNVFRKASAISFGLWIALLTWVYLYVSPEHFRRLKGAEQSAAIVAVSCLIVCFFVIVVVPLGLHHTDSKKASEQMSGILVASITVSVIAISTNVLLAFSPAAVMIDPVTRAPVYLFRWCEWAPLGGLMTWLAEAVDLPRDPKKRKHHLASALIQGLGEWVAVMAFSFVTYLMIFPRVVKRYRALHDFEPRNNCVADKEHFDRLCFAFKLVTTCAIAWTILVVLYFINMLLYRFASPDHFLRHPALAMMLDTFFDVLAKGFYMVFIVDVHRLVYDPVARTRRQLKELSRLVSVLWDCASEIIVISVSNGGKMTSMFSPSFLRIMGYPENQNALVVDTTATDERSYRSKGFITDKGPTVLDAYCVQASAVSRGDFVGVKRFGDYFVPPSAHRIKQACKLLRATRQAGLFESGSILDHRQYPPGYGECTLESPEKAEVYCEINSTCYDDNAVIGIARDMTERHRRSQAERMAHEMLARQKEAQSINRFTRHEVKNGLLSGIEIVESLKRMQTLKKLSPTAQAKLLNDLGEQLHHTLDTVLSETMARDVIYREYLPKLEPAEIENLITSTIDSKNPERFPLKLIPAEMPRLHLDPQLIRYIHRNAVSNAVKYGKQGGLVQTVAEYSCENNELEICVINEPGVGHADLVELGEEASSGVFQQGKRLHKHLGDDINGTLSTGDGAWIMQKCATTLNGECKIHFEPDRTVFSVRFPVEVSWKHDETDPFCIPEDTWGIAVDDSKIQRKLMGRLLVNVGIDERKVVVLGVNSEEVRSLSSYFSAILNENPKAKILVLMDENLDFRVKQQSPGDGEGTTGATSTATEVLSGSLLASKALSELPPEQEKRLLVLVRSANDAVSDVDLYQSRTHGFFPKAPMRKERILEILCSQWKARFGTHS
eukprot:scaffold1064_cov85-Amphora_coffeaeformis.AAC.25